MKPIYQFLLWDNCNNNCKFCLQRQHARIFCQQQQSFILNKVLDFINSSNFIQGSHILLVGGEIFDNPKLTTFLLPFFKKIVQLMNNNVIDLFYINTNLLYNNKLLLEFLQLFHAAKLFQRLKFTSSFDIYGRFLNENAKSLMLNNLKEIKQLFTNLNIVLNTILTKQCCQQILSDKFNIFQFMDEYNVYINLLPLINGCAQMKPARQLVFKTLLHVNNQNSNYINYYIKDMSLTQPRYLYIYKNGCLQLCNCQNAECGHSINFKTYSDKHSCFCCDLKNIFAYEL